MKNKKAISPVLAVLLMIAVAVAAALVTYAWVMTYLSSTTGRAGHAVQIQSVDWIDADTVHVYVQNVGDGTVELTNSFIDGALNDIADQTIPEGTTVQVIITDLAYNFLAGDDVYIKVTCDDGTFTEGKYTVEFA